MIGQLAFQKVTGTAKDIGSQVLVHVPGAATPDYRDFTVTMADDDANIGQDFMPYPTSARAGASLVNYQAAPAGDGPNSFRNPGNVPVLTAYAGDPTTVHALVAPGSENSHVFSLGGLRWDQDPFMTNSNWLTAQAVMGRCVRLPVWPMSNPAGSATSCPQPIPIFQPALTR